MTGDERADSMPADDRWSAWLDGELTPDVRAALDAQRRSDPECRRALDDLRETRTLVRGLGFAEPPPGFLESLVSPNAPENSDTPSGVVLDLDAARRRHRRRSSGIGAVAAAAALIVAIVIPGVTRAHPALATDIRVHQAGVSSSGDPISGLAPLGTPMKLGR